MPGRLGPAPLGRAVRPGIIDEPAAEPVTIVVKPVAERAAKPRAPRILLAVPEHIDEPAAEPVGAVIEPGAEHAAGPGAHRVISRRARAHGDELHNEPEWRGE